MTPYSAQWIEEDDIVAVSDVLRGTHLTQGPAIEKFEKALEAYLGVKHVIAVSNGTAALHLAILALKEILGAHRIRGFVPPITFAASLNCLWYIGGSASLVDVDSLTGQMTPQTLAAALLKATMETPRAMGEKWVIIPVSLQGRPLDYDGLKRVADKYDAVLVEDAAHAMGGYYTFKGEKCKMGGCAHTFAATTSFHAVKQLCMGEGGAVMTNDDAFAAKIRLLRSHGIVRPGRPSDPSWYYEQVDLGYNFRLTDMQCALGFRQLGKLDSRLERRHALACRYEQVFEQKPFADYLSFAPRLPGHAYHLYVVHFSSEEIRNSALEFLKTRDYLSQVHYTPLYHFPYHRVRLNGDFFPGAEQYFRGALSIPLFPKMTDAQQDGVIDALREFLLGLPKPIISSDEIEIDGVKKICVKMNIQPRKVSPKINEGEEDFERDAWMVGGGNISKIVIDKPCRAFIGKKGIGYVKKSPLASYNLDGAGESLRGMN